MARVMVCAGRHGGAPTLDVALSERNLLTLLGKLHTPGSGCSFLNGDVPQGFAFARFGAEPGECHYAHPSREGAPRGPMHPLSELISDAIRQLFDSGAAQALLGAEDDPLRLRAADAGWLGGKDGADG